MMVLTLIGRGRSGLWKEVEKSLNLFLNARGVVSDKLTLSVASTAGP